MASIAGNSSLPRLVSEYSTDGGEVGLTVRVIIPFDSSSFSLTVKTLAEIAGISILSSLNLLTPPLKLQITFGVQAPPNTDIHSDKGHPNGTGGLLFFLTFKPISMLFYMLSVT